MSGSPSDLCALQGHTQEILSSIPQNLNNIASSKDYTDGNMQETEYTKGIEEEAS